MPQFMTEGDRLGEGSAARPPVPHGDIPKFSDAVIDHVIQKAHDAIGHYNGGRHLQSIVDISFAVEECSKLKELRDRHDGGAGLSREDLSRLLHHKSKFAYYDDAVPPGYDDAVPPGYDDAVPPGYDDAVPPGYDDNRGKTRLLSAGSALYGLVAFRELANYVDFRRGTVISARKIFINQETLRQFAYCAIYWAVRAMRLMLINNSIYGTSALFPFCKAGSLPPVPAIRDMFGILAELKRGLRGGQDARGPLGALTSALEGAGMRESFSRVHATLTTVRDPTKSVASAIPAPGGVGSLLP